MAVIKYYVHDNYETPEVEEYLEEKGISPDKSIVDNFQNLFYEVAFDVDVNRHTGECKIIAVNGQPLAEASAIGR